MFRAVLLLLAMIFVTNSALAEWVAIAESDSGISLIKTESIRKSGSKVKLWALDDMASPVEMSDGEYRSSMTQIEFDCKNDRTRTLSGAFYSGSMGEGATVFLFSENEKGEWRSVIPDSVGQSQFNYACERVRLPVIHKVNRKTLVKLMETRLGDSYADRNSIARKGDTVQIWKIYNFKSPMKHSELRGYLSMQAYL